MQKNDKLACGTMGEGNGGKPPRRALLGWCRAAKFALACLAVIVAGTAPSCAADALRIGFQKTGTFAWLLDVVRRHDLAREAGLELQTTEFASTEAAKLALNGGTVDIAVSDWLWVARERALGQRLKFYPYSSAVGAIMVKNDSPLKNLADLKGRVLGVAGGPLDKSWLIVRAAALRHGIDLKRDATLQYGAPPLVFQKVQQGESDANLNFWNFCARLEARGYRRLYDVREAETELGLTQPVAAIGYVFTESFAASHREAIDRFIGMAQRASDLMRRSDAEWEALRPLVGAEDEATFAAMRAAARDGIPHRPLREEEADAARLFKTLAEIGGPELVGPASELDLGLYYHPTASGE